MTVEKKTDDRVAVIGGGLAGLSSAIALHAKGYRVTLFEAAGHAGGRCRSFFDSFLERNIDNGAHLMLAGNHEISTYVQTIGSTDTLQRYPPVYCFFDKAHKRLRRFHLGPGGFPLSLIKDAFRLFRATPQTTVADCLGNSRNFPLLWDPLCVSILNTPSCDASASLVRHVLWLIIKGGKSAASPSLPRGSLGTSLIEPALRFLERSGVPIHFHARLRRLEEVTEGMRLHFDDAAHTTDRVVLALPHREARRLLPELPDLSTHVIVNAHFRLASPPSFPLSSPFLGMTGGTAHWLFWRDGVLSVTVSAADDLALQSNEAIAALLWDDCREALGLEESTMPPVRILRERQATIAHTPQTLTRRPEPGHYRGNLFLAGDWTDTGLPCTIEGALLSGKKAAAALPIIRA